MIFFNNKVHFLQTLNNMMPPSLDISEEIEMEKEHELDSPSKPFFTGDAIHLAFKDWEGFSLFFSIFTKPFSDTVVFAKVTAHDLLELYGLDDSDTITFQQALDIILNGLHVYNIILDETIKVESLDGFDFEFDNLYTFQDKITKLYKLLGNK